MDEQLEWVTELFDSNDVTHWIESGTLLTLVRSGELTKYDDDIDVAILAEDVDTLEGLIPEIEREGYQVQSRSYHGRKYKFQFIPTKEKGSRSRTNRRLIDVMVFRRNGDHAWTAQSQVRDEFDLPGMGTLVDSVYPLAQQYARSAGGNIEVTSFPKSYLLDVLTLWIPRLYIDDVTYDEELGVHRPAAVEDYLTFRYGDWRTPVSEWSLTDDGAIRRAEPLEVVRDDDYRVPAEALP